MLSKTKRPYDAESLPPGKRLRANVQDLFASNTLSGRRIQEIINDAHDAGAVAMAPLHGRVDTNSARFLRRAFLRRNQWPGLYWARLRVRGKTSHNEEHQKCSFLLPHEFVEVLCRLGEKTVLLQTGGLDPKSKEHLEMMQTKAGQPLLALGLWGDGVPCNWDRTESVEVFSLNLPGLTGDNRTLRMPLTALSRKQITPHTWDDILEVLSWSLRHCFAGTLPRCRHDDSAFWNSDAKRLAHYEKLRFRLGVRACLVEVRGDWKMYKELFHFPAWNTRAGCCWRCKATPAEAFMQL